MPTLTRTDDVFLLDLGDGENRFTPDWLSAVEAALDEVATAAPAALVTAATGKFYSYGLDLDNADDYPGGRDAYIIRVHALFARVLTLPMVTVAALNGHAFGAGAMIALSHDFRVMRADRGFWCLPEADVGLPFTRAMSALVQSRLSAPVAHEAMVSSRRYGGTDAQAAGIVDRAVDDDSLRSCALEIAAAHTGKAGKGLSIIKTRMYATTVDLLRDTDKPRD